MEAQAVRTLEAMLAAEKNSLREAVAAVWRDRLARLEERLTLEFSGSVDRLLDERLARLARDLEARLSSERDQARLEAATAAIERLAGSLNQSFRRLRQTGTTEGVARWLIDAVTPLVSCAAILGVSQGHLEGIQVSGVTSEAARERFDRLYLPMEETPAAAQAVREKEPVVTVAAPKQISATLAGILGCEPGERICLLPVVIRGETAALLCALTGDRNADLSSLELLTQMAAAAAEGLLSAGSAPIEAAQPDNVAPLVQINGTARQRAAPETPDWSALSRDDQLLHVLARRFARVQVAEMRLYHANDVEKGRAEGRLYYTLQEPIDQARAAFRGKFLDASQTMVDYLHRELVRSLVNDNPALLGRDYPGPLR